MFCIPGFQQFDYEEIWCGFHCVYPACGSPNFLDMWLYSFHHIWSIFSHYFFRYVSSLPTFFLELQLYICLDHLILFYRLLRLCSFLFQSFGLCALVFIAVFKFTDHFFYRILVLLQPCHVFFLDIITLSLEVLFDF